MRSFLGGYTLDTSVFYMDTDLSKLVRKPVGSVKMTSRQVCRSDRTTANLGLAGNNRRGIFLDITHDDG
jgi:hypothetical protein